MSRKKRNQKRRQVGFSLIVIFLLLALMAAAATAVLLATRTDTRVAGRHRETTLAFFSAEAGIAYGKAYLTTQWAPAGFWTSVLDDPPNAVTYQVGGFNISPGDKLPLMNSRYTYTFTNNPDDSGGPNVDTDGRIVVTSVGQALDRTGNKVLAQVTLQVEVEWSAVQFLKGDYQTQQGQSASGVSKSTDTGSVDMGSSRTF
jgi:Tfp pilus assembly protein PilX